MYQIHPTTTATLVRQRRDAFEAHAATARLVRRTQPTRSGRHFRLGFGSGRGVLRRRPVLV